MLSKYLVKHVCTGHLTALPASQLRHASEQGHRHGFGQSKPPPPTQKKQQPQQIVKKVPKVPTADLVQQSQHKPADTKPIQATVQQGGGQQAAAQSSKQQHAEHVHATAKPTATESTRINVQSATPQQPPISSTSKVTATDARTGVSPVTQSKLDAQHTTPSPHTPPRSSAADSTAQQPPASAQVDQHQTAKLVQSPEPSADTTSTPHTARPDASAQADQHATARLIQSPPTLEPAAAAATPPTAPQPRYGTYAAVAGLLLLAFYMRDKILPTSSDSDTLIQPLSQHVNTARSGGSDYPIVSPDSAVVHPTIPEEEARHKQLHAHEHREGTGDEHDAAQHSTTVRRDDDSSVVHNHRDLNALQHHSVDSKTGSSTPAQMPPTDKSSTDQGKLVVDAVPALSSAVPALSHAGVITVAQSNTTQQPTDAPVKPMQQQTQTTTAPEMDNAALQQQQQERQQAAIKEQQLLQSLLQQIQQVIQYDMQAAQQDAERAQQAQHAAQQAKQTDSQHTANVSKQQQAQQPADSRQNSKQDAASKAAAGKRAEVTPAKLNFDSAEAAQLYLDTLQHTLQQLQQKPDTPVETLLQSAQQSLQQQLDTELQQLQQQYDDQLQSQRSAAQQQVEQQKQQLIDAELLRIQRVERAKYEQHLQQTLQQLQQAYDVQLKRDRITQNDAVQREYSIERGQRMLQLKQLSGQIQALKQVIDKQNRFNTLNQHLFTLSTVQSVYAAAHRSNNYSQLSTVQPLIQSNPFLQGVFSSILPHAQFAMSAAELQQSYALLHTQALEALYLPSDAAVASDSLLINLLAKLSSKLTIQHNYFFDQNQVSQRYDKDFMLLNRSYHAVQQRDFNAAVQYIERIDNRNIQQLMHNWVFYCKLKLQCDTVDTVLRSRIEELNAQMTLTQ